jgi:hypothetical protein
MPEYNSLWFRIKLFKKTKTNVEYEINVLCVDDANVHAASDSAY